MNVEDTRTGPSGAAPESTPMLVVSDRSPVDVAGDREASHSASQTMQSGPPSRTTWWRRVPIRDLGGVMVFAAVIGLFSALKPDVFPTLTNFKLIFGQVAVTAVVAVGVTVPLMVGEFDFSVGAMVSLGAVMAAKLLSDGSSPAVAILAAIGLGIGFGLVNGFVVVRFRVSSFIGTIAVSSLMLSLAQRLTGGTTFTGLPPEFTSLVRRDVLGISYPTIYAVFLGFVLWMLSRFFVIGREIRAVGGNREAARIAGIRIGAYRVLAFAVSGGLAAFAGVLLAGRTSSADALMGNEFLIPAFAGAFLGAALAPAGRFDVIATLLGVLLLGIIGAGLALLRTPFWLPNLVTGLLLLCAVTLAANVRREARGAAS